MKQVPIWMLEWCPRKTAPFLWVFLSNHACHSCRLWPITASEQHNQLALCPSTQLKPTHTKQVLALQLVTCLWYLLLTEHEFIKSLINCWKIIAYLQQPCVWKVGIPPCINVDRLNMQDTLYKIRLTPLFIHFWFFISILQFWKREAGYGFSYLMKSSPHVVVNQKVSLWNETQGPKKV